ncbi:MAG: hypothetical protein BMS9Abin30_0365 [Gammaproteobacteria bacterium]|nr:MAG: hypothetical protein BMS9Abin30_0365 [Gammaproteobacteria bacterium]
MSFFEELKRRNVVRVGIVYVIAAWLLLQLTDVLVELLGLPDTAGKFVVLLLIIGFIPALIFAWAFEMTPDGIKREKDVDRSQSIASKTGRNLDRSIIAILVLAVIYFVYDKFQAEDTEVNGVAVETASQSGAPADVGAVRPDPSIAVLPFADLSPQQDQGYFSDGIAEELLNLLVRVDGLKVASRTSSFAYKGSKQSLAEIAGELGVDQVLEGSVRKADNRVRITAQLIDAKTDRHLWSETFDRDLVDIFAIQDEIANAIVGALRSELGILQDVPTITVTADTENLDAYELYLKARGLFLAREQLEESVRLFEQAVTLDPKFTRAWGGLAAVYSVVESWGITGRDWDTLAMQAAEKALALDPNLSAPWAVIGQLANNRGDPAAGLENLNKAIELDPTNATNYLWRGLQLSELGFHTRSIVDLEKCLELDPAYGNCRRHLAISQLLVGNEAVALTLLQQGMESGFAGSLDFFIQFLVNSGNRFAAAAILYFRSEQDARIPAKAILDAIEFPQRDHSAGLSKYQAWAEKYDYSELKRPIYMSIFGEYRQIEPDAFSNRWVWLKESAGFRKSRYFKPFVRKLGWLSYWKKNGFPDNCRPLAKEDFECD